MNDGRNVTAEQGFRLKFLFLSPLHLTSQVSSSPKSDSPSERAGTLKVPACPGVSEHGLAVGLRVSLTQVLLHLRRDGRELVLYPHHVDQCRALRLPVHIGMNEGMGSVQECRLIFFCGDISKHRGAPEFMYSQSHFTPGKNTSIDLPVS